jgi:SAM-dependent methyltransferase
MNNLNIIKNYYNFYLKKYKKGPRAVNWSSQDSQILRFNKILEAGNFNNKRVHDVGCGLADFYKFLKKNKIKCQYMGSDISKEMINSGKNQIGLKKINLQNLNLLKINNKKLLKSLSADYVVANGLFTVKSTITNRYWWNYTKKMLEKMFLITNECLIFNMMKNNVDFKDRHLYYQQTDQLLKFLEKKLSKKIVIKSDYPLYEYMCYVYKK